MKKLKKGEIHPSRRLAILAVDALFRNRIDAILNNGAALPGSGHIICDVMGHNALVNWHKHGGRLECDGPIMRVSIWWKFNPKGFKDPRNMTFTSPQPAIGVDYYKDVMAASISCYLRYGEGLPVIIGNQLIGLSDSYVRRGETNALWDLQTLTPDKFRVMEVKEKNPA